MLNRDESWYPPPLGERNEAARDGEGEQVSRGWYPVLNVMEAGELCSMITVLVPGVEHYYREEDGRRTAWMLHPDGSWARASAVESDPPVVHQGGVRRLWDLLDEVRDLSRWQVLLPHYGASATITPDGGIHLAAGNGGQASLNQEATDRPCSALTGTTSARPSVTGSRRAPGRATAARTVPAGLSCQLRRRSLAHRRWSAVRQGVRQPTTPWGKTCSITWKP